jgi:hypothetical protein
MDINTGLQQDSCYPDARFDEKGCVQVWGGDALIALPKNTLPIHLLKPTSDFPLSVTYHGKHIAYRYHNV